MGDMRNGTVYRVILEERLKEPNDGIADPVTIRHVDYVAYIKDANGEVIAEQQVGCSTLDATTLHIYQELGNINARSAVDSFYQFILEQLEEGTEYQLDASKAPSLSTEGLLSSGYLH